MFKLTILNQMRERALAKKILKLRRDFIPQIESALPGRATVRYAPPAREEKDMLCDFSTSTSKKLGPF